MEKLELIKLLADVNNDAVLKKIRDILQPDKTAVSDDKLQPNSEMVRKLREARLNINGGKGSSTNEEDLW